MCTSRTTKREHHPQESKSIEVFKAKFAYFPDGLKQSKNASMDGDGVQSFYFLLKTYCRRILKAPLAF